MRLRFEWDRAKAASNLRKRGVSFETAVRVFADPLARTDADRIEAGERRWQTIRVVAGLCLVIAARTIEVDERHDVEVVRLISARVATRQERRRYEQENG
jgi:uncharacterized DUF497 family protein